MLNKGIRRGMWCSRWNIDMKIADYLAGLGAPFEAFLNQDSGNKCYSFWAEAGPMWVKVLNLEQTPITDLQAVIDFYNGLQSPLIPRNWRLIELEDGLLMQHDWVPGRVLHSPEEDRHDPGSTYQQFMRLPVEKRLAAYAVILHLFVEIEAKGVVIEDFYDGCILYDFETHQAHVCDLDHIHHGTYVLEKERQYGSARFMAPEEFQKGSLIDRRTNVYTLGATGFVLLNDNRRERADWPLGEATYRVLAKAISANKEDRQGSVREFSEQWVIILDHPC
jgi:serine/threonine-protein kinase